MSESENKVNVEKSESKAGELVTFESPAQATAVRNASLKALVVRKRAGDGDTRAISNPWDCVDVIDGIVEPPLDPDSLNSLVGLSTELPPSIAAMEINIPGFGWRLRRHPDVSEDKAEAEREWASEFLTYADYDEHSFTNLRRRTRKDIETTGNAYWEVIRDGAGRPCSFRLTESHTMRMTLIDTVSTSVKRVRPTGRGDSRGTKTVERLRRFRRYVQARHTLVPDEPEVVYFREYGDPRELNWQTGEYETPDTPVPPELRANEVIHFSIYATSTPYGLPRYVGAILTASGLRGAEEINWASFKNNNIPSLALLVSNGQLTDATITRLSEFVESNIQGDDNWNKIVVIEAAGDEDPMDGSSQVRIEMKPLSDAQHTDALFQQYDKQGRDKLRRMFRLAPIFTGATDDYSRSCYSADTETLTENGWKRYWEVEPGEKIATYNPESGGLEYHEPVDGLRLYDYDGPMHHYRNRNTDVLVTPDHRMWSRPDNPRGKWRIERAEDLKRARFRFRSAPDFTASGSAPDYVDVPELVLRDGPNAGVRPAIRVPIALWVEFVAAFIADGSTASEFVKGKRRCMYNVIVGVHKPRKIELFGRLFAAFRDLGFRVFNPSVDKAGKTTFALADKVLWRMLREYGTSAAEKRLPEFFTSLPVGLARLVLQTLKITDGSADSRQGRTSWAYSSSSIALADQVQTLAVRLGHRAKRIVTRHSPPVHDNYRVLIVPDKREHKVTQAQVSSPWYTGKVYCFEVPNHLFFTRRNGVVAIQGNTAETSRKLTDEQVFDPERRDDDWTINRVLVDMGMVYHKFETNTPNVTNDQDLIAVMQGAEKTGGMTPAIARIMLEDILGRELGPVSADVNPDVPFSLSMAEAVKNMAKPNEPGQQVTALKAATRALGLADEWGYALDLVEIAKGEGAGGPRADVVLNAGSQAGDLAAGTQAVYLSATALGLDGRELHISDGATAVAKVRFGTRARLPTEAAAKAAGLNPAEVAKMFPGRVELWTLPIEARHRLETPVEYSHPEGSEFGFLVPPTG